MNTKELTRRTSNRLSDLKDIMPESLFEDLIANPLTLVEKKHIEKALTVQFLDNLKRLYAVTSRARYG